MNKDSSHLPAQYERDACARINHSYLKEQFSDYQEIFSEIETCIRELKVIKTKTQEFE